MRLKKRVEKLEDKYRKLENRIIQSECSHPSYQLEYDECSLDVFGYLRMVKTCKKCGKRWIYHDDAKFLNEKAEWLIERSKSNIEQSKYYKKKAKEAEASDANN